MKGLTYVHIGKCGGTTIQLCVKESPILKEKYGNVRVVHTISPGYSPNQDYLISIRNPINRLVSAFNWRHKRVVIDSEAGDLRERNMVPNEYEILKKYGSPNAIAEKLYVDGELDREVYSELFTIAHIYNGIPTHINSFIDKVDPACIFGVITQENLNDDCERVLGVVNDKHTKGNSHKSNVDLSQIAIENLRKVLHKDYSCIEKLNDLGALTERQYTDLLTDPSANI